LRREIGRELKSREDEEDEVWWFAFNGEREMLKGVSHSAYVFLFLF